MSAPAPMKTRKPFLIDNREMREMIATATSNFFLRNGYLGIRFRSREEIAPRGSIMDMWSGRIRPPWVDRRSEDDAARATRAVCTAYVWLALYGIAIAGSFFWGSSQHKHEAPVVAAASAEP